MKVGVALGGGGVRGLAHVPVLEVLDDLGIRPAVIAGTSMGAIIGALYASGLSAREIREGVGRHVILKDDKWRDVIEKKNDLLKWISAFKNSFTRAGLEVVAKPHRHFPTIVMTQANWKKATNILT